MTKNQILGKATLERKFKRVDIVDTFADERALTEHILVNIGYSSRIGVNAGFISKHPRISRPVRAGKAHRDARLKNTVTLRDSLPGLVINCTVQWMRHCSYQLPCGVAGQLSVGIERDDILHL